VSSRLIVFGAGGHGRAVADLATECGFTVLGMTEPARSRPGVIGDDARGAALLRAGEAEGGIVGVGNSELRRRATLFHEIRQCGHPVPTLVHPRAVVSRSCGVGEGVVIFAGCVLGAGVRVGDNAVLYSGAIAEHDCVIGDHAYLAPAVVLSGGVRIARGAFLGVGAVVLPDITIGENAIVGAGAVVIADVAPGQTVAGVPARARANA